MSAGDSLWQEAVHTLSLSQLTQRTLLSSLRDSEPVQHAFARAAEQWSDSASHRAWTQGPSGGQTEQWLITARTTLSLILREAWNQAARDRQRRPFTTRSTQNSHDRPTLRQLVLRTLRVETANVTAESLPVDVLMVRVYSTRGAIGGKAVEYHWTTRTGPVTVGGAVLQPLCCCSLMSVDRQCTLLGEGCYSSHCWLAMS